MTVKLLNDHKLEFISLKGGCSLHLSKLYIVGNHMLRLIYSITFKIQGTIGAVQQTDLNRNCLAYFCRIRPRMYVEGLL